MDFAYHPDLEKAIGSLQKEFATAANPLALRSFLSVGANRDKTEPDKLCVEDSRYTYATLLHLGILDIPFAENYDHRLMNLMNGEDEDFLKHPQKTDLLMVCYIPFHVQNLSPTAKTGLRISHDHFVSAAWQKAAIDSGCKVISILGGEREIKSSHFTASPDSPFIALSDYTLKASFAEKRPTTPYHSPAQILLHKDYASELLAHQQLSATAKHVIFG